MFIQILEQKYIRDASVTAAHAWNVFKIYGKDPHFLQGKVKQTKPLPATLPHLSPLPPDVSQEQFTLRIDIFFLNELCFFFSYRF